VIFLGNEDPQTVFINESGFYSIILASKKEEAKNFKKWVTIKYKNL
jgi:prophage antirepressor-like protein